MKYLIYKTTNTVNGKEYIGIHQTENVDDGYLGSGLALLKAVKKYGKQNFKRVILEFCSSYDELIEREKFYVNEEWVSDRNNYNLKTGGQSSGLLSEESKLKISETLKQKYLSGELIPRYTKPYKMTEDHKKQISESLKKRYEEVPHHTIGSTPWNKGKTGVQVGWNKGLVGVQVGWSKGMELGPLSDEHRSNISNGLKEYYKDNPNPMLGKEPWNKGKKAEQVECPHCGKMSNHGNANRWHFDNCKHKS